MVGCAVLVFAVLSLGFPATVASWSYDLGNYGIATKYAALYYSYTGKTEDLATCTGYAILSEKDSYIIEYCSELIDCDDFSDYCKEYDAVMNEALSSLGYTFSYRQYIYGKLAVAYYSSGELQSAIGTAVEAVAEGYDWEQYVLSEELNFTISYFPVTNALGSLVLNVSDDDSVAAENILQVFDKVDTGSLTVEQQNYFTTLQVYLEEIAS